MPDNTQENPLLDPASQTAPAGSPNRQNWIRLAVLATAGFLGPILVFFLGDRLRHCPPAVGPTLPAGHSYNCSHAADAHATSLAVFDDPAWQLAAVDRLKLSWGLDSLKFVTIADEASNTSNIGLGKYKHSIIVATIHGSSPQRRQEKQPYMSAPHGGVIMQTLPLAAINKAAAGLEAALGRRLFPLMLEVADLPGKAEPLSPPFATYDVSSGRITVEAAVFRRMAQFTDLTEGVSVFTEALFSQISRFTSLKDSGDLKQVAQVVLLAAVSAVGIAIAYQVPLWFCIACPVVLGMLAPFVINGGLALLASEACTHWALPTEECNDLWYGVFAAGMVLSLASAIPIVFICKLPQCAHRHRTK